MSDTYVRFRPNKKAIDTFFDKALVGEVSTAPESVVPIGIKKLVPPVAAPTGKKRSRSKARKHKRKKTGAKVPIKKKRIKGGRSKLKREKKYRIEKALREYKLTK
jgi:hypothetical protein